MSIRRLPGYEDRRRYDVGKCHAERCRSEITEAEVNLVGIIDGDRRR